MEKRPSNLVQIWFQAIRFPSLISSLIPAMLGGAFAVIDRAFITQTLPFLLAMLIFMLIQAGTNLFNEYYDYKYSARTTGVSFKMGVLHDGRLTPKQVYYGGIVCYIAASMLGIYLTTWMGSGFLWFVLVGVLLGYLYTGGPYPLAYRGLGELAVLFSMGPVVVLGTYYGQVGFVRGTVFLGAISIGVMAMATVHTNNLRDREMDRSVGKITWASLSSEKTGKQQLTILLLIPYLLQAILATVELLPWTSWITFLTLPLVLLIIRRVWTSTTHYELNLVLGLTVLLQLLYGIAYTLGLLSSVLLG
ncbi:1,4-dihydroxy-2-naphthoate octaprenyltransferase [Effusibacillus consociatus]|uniref:1,4-dihydroxy-2-naphthoate octaprenyltransferase n=1 Tax=Effusibacillus consociatus TaxID=1117041 RepID=A0ABV9Q652_9BACL